MWVLTHVSCLYSWYRLKSPQSLLCWALGQEPLTLGRFRLYSYLSKALGEQKWQLSLGACSDPITRWETDLRQLILGISWGVPEPGKYLGLSLNTLVSVETSLFPSTQVTAKLSLILSPAVSRTHLKVPWGNFSSMVAGAQRTLSETGGSSV